MGQHNYDADSDALRVTVAPTMGDMDEMMTFSFDEVSDSMGMLTLHWADVEVPISISTGS